MDVQTEGFFEKFEHLLNNQDRLATYIKWPFSEKNKCSSKKVFFFEVFLLLTFESRFIKIS